MAVSLQGTEEHSAIKGRIQDRGPGESHFYWLSCLQERVNLLLSSRCGTSWFCTASSRCSSSLTSCAMLPTPYRASSSCVPWACTVALPSKVSRISTELSKNSSSTFARSLPLTLKVSIFRNTICTPWTPHWLSAFGWVERSSMCQKPLCGKRKTKRKKKGFIYATQQHRLPGENNVFVQNIIGFSRISWVTHLLQCILVPRNKVSRMYTQELCCRNQTVHILKTGNSFLETCLCGT